MATAMKRALEELKIGEPWKQTLLAAERWHVGNVRLWPAVSGNPPEDSSSAP